MISVICAFWSAFRPRDSHLTGGSTSLFVASEIRFQWFCLEIFVCPTVFFSGIGSEQSSWKLLKQQTFFFCLACQLMRTDFLGPTAKELGRRAVLGSKPTESLNQLINSGLLLSKEIHFLVLVGRKWAVVSRPKSLPKLSNFREFRVHAANGRS